MIGFAFRIATMGSNAPRVSKEIGFILRSVMKEGGHITDEVKAEKLFDLEQLYLASTSVTVGFGIPIDTTIAPNFSVCLFRNSDPSLGGGFSSVFNAVRFSFTINQDTPVN